MIDKVIAEYMSTGRRLTVPGLGIFIRRKDSDEVIFSPLYSNDDGILRQMVQDRIHMSEEKTEIVLKHFVQEILKYLEMEGKYAIEGLGTLYRKGDETKFIYSGSHYADAVFRQKVGTGYNMRPVQQAPAAQQEEAQQPAVPQAAEEERPRPSRTQAPAVTDEPAPTPKPEAPAVNPAASLSQGLSSKVSALRTRLIDSINGERNDSGDTDASQSNNERPLRTVNRGKRPDMVLVLAVIAAVIALCIIVFGSVSRNPQPLLDREVIEQINGTSAGQDIIQEADGAQEAGTEGEN